MKVLITGGAGYIGTELSYKLSSINEVEEIIIYDNLSRGNYNLFIGRNQFPDGKVRFVHGDLLDSRKLKKIVSEVDVVYHLAAKVTTPFSDQNTHLFEQVNHWGTAEVVYAVEESNVSQFFYLSSASVYGSGSETVNEETNPKPETYYGSSKLRGEDHVVRLSNKINAHVIRCGNVYGYSKSMRFDAVINKFMFEANFNRKILIKGDGGQRRAFIHIDKVVACLQNLLLKSTSSAIFNLVDLNLSVVDIAGNLKEIYPDLDMIFVDQHLKLREITVDFDDRLSAYFERSNPEKFKDELIEFGKHLTF